MNWISEAYGQCPEDLASETVVIGSLLFDINLLDRIPEVKAEMFSVTDGVNRRHLFRYLVDYFPSSRQEKMRSQSLHLDPEFTTFTYGDPTPPKSGLRRLGPGDLLVFYCGLKG